MNKISKTLIGAGALGLALLGAAAPANAATTDRTVSASQSVSDAEGDRLIGPFHTNSKSGTYEWNAWGAPSAAGVDVTSKAWGSGGTPRGGDTFTFPAPGTSGPIKPANNPNLCLQGANELDAKVTAQACDGSAEQTYTVGTDGLITASGGLYPSNARAQTGSYMYAVSNVQIAERLRLAELTPVAPADIPVDITGPSEGEVVPTSKPEFSGTGEPGAEVIVTDDAGNELARATVDENGNWSTPSTVELPDGPHHVTATQTDTDGNVTTDDVNFTIVDDDPESPVIDPIVAGAGVVLLAGIGATAIVRRKNAVKA